MDGWVGWGTLGLAPGRWELLNSKPDNDKVLRFLAAT